MVALEDLERAVKRAAAARKESHKASDARAALPPGTGRARVTSANAKASIKAEAYTLALNELEQLIKRAAAERIAF